MDKLKEKLEDLYCNAVWQDMPPSVFSEMAVDKISEFIVEQEIGECNLDGVDIIAKKLGVKMSGNQIDLEDSIKEIENKSDCTDENLNWCYPNQEDEK